MQRDKIIERHVGVLAVETHVTSVGKQGENDKKEQKDATIDNPVILDKIADDVTEEKKHVTWAEKIAQLKKIPRRGKGKSLILLKQSKL